MDLSQRGEKSHFSDPQSIATCKDPVTILLLGTADSGKSTVVKQMKVKFIYFERATKFCEISTLILSHVVPVKSKVEISQNFVAYSQYIYEL